MHALRAGVRVERVVPVQREIHAGDLPGVGRLALRLFLPAALLLLAFSFPLFLRLSHPRPALRLAAHIDLRSDLPGGIVVVKAAQAQQLKDGYLPI